jgi:hypothetical protein
MDEIIGAIRPRTVERLIVAELKAERRVLGRALASADAARDRDDAFMVASAVPDQDVFVPLSSTSVIVQVPAGTVAVATAPAFAVPVPEGPASLAADGSLHAERVIRRPERTMRPRPLFDPMVVMGTRPNVLSPLATFFCCGCGSGCG